MMISLGPLTLENAKLLKRNPLDFLIRALKYQQHLRLEQCEANWRCTKTIDGIGACSSAFKLKSTKSAQAK